MLELITFISKVVAVECITEVAGPIASEIPDVVIYNLSMLGVSKKAERFQAV